ncbi:MAG: UTRA domain-containing protein [Anaerolineaceae bacterium]|nr:UTRA domain-containing protein [Anaerolineaceae bacterium]
MSKQLSYFHIDQNSPIPLYYQIQQNIIELIEANVIRAGDPLPSERELSDLYAVNRMTLRQAMNELCSQGILRRVRGVGTFVTEKNMGTPFVPAVTGFSERFRNSGYKPTSRVITLEVIQASPLVAQRLQLDENDQVISLVRLRFLDDEPLMLEKSFLSYNAYPDLIEQDFSVQSLYDVLAQHYGVHILETEQTLEPTLLKTEESKLFELKAGLPAMLVSITAYTTDHQPIEFSKSVVRGDRCRYYFTVDTSISILAK